MALRHTTDGNKLMPLSPRPDHDLAATGADSRRDRPTQHVARMNDEDVLGRAGLRYLPL